MLLEIRDGSACRNGTPVLSHFSFEIRGTEKIAVTGRNGAGKTTLLKVLAGEIELEKNEKNPDSGMTQARTFSLGMLNQQAADQPEKTVEELVQQALLSGRPAEYRFSPEYYEEEQRYHRMLTNFGFPLSARTKKLKEFSGGEQTKLMLIRLLLLQPDVLILDEPTNHLDLDSVEWLENYIRNYKKAVVMVSHDRYFLDRTADVVWEAAGQKLVRYPGNYSAFVKEKAAAYERKLKKYRQQQEEIEREKELIARFKNRPRKAAFARNRKKLLERMKPAEKPDPDDAVIHFGEILPARRGGRWVYECEHLETGYDRGKPLQEISFRIRRGQKIGILGPNGSGKSTFLRTIAGKLPPLSGSQRMGEHTDAAYFDQMSADIRDACSVLEWFHDRYPALHEKEIREILAGYLFRGKDLGKRVCDLSGGEKARLVLASLLQSGPNFLILDEPTNYMDIPAKETMESVFRCYRGTILFVSHDRYFLDRVADSLLIFEKGNKEVRYYPFGYTHYRESRRKAADGQDAAAVRTAENQRLIEELRAVPKAERFRLREISTEEAELDWRFGLNKREREKAEKDYRDACAALEEIRCLRLKEFAENVGISERAESRAGGSSCRTYAEAGDGRQELSAVTAEKPEKPETAEEKTVRTCARWTRTCLDWYEIWLDTPDGQKT
ncbi:ABC-F family ATP-binding cassette domain-containing protein [Bilifractor porci]|jgi:ATP-binding cassette subfamily F protein 3|uniref:ABC-F family ATP-binding cassette domain-containing protein n=1 Tax=Bilifractor porci TaxID=2606636 RepID=A0A7X2P8G5_9FIRM|nr:ABC-F family ATP-binding cassette domain-containing protein [Bilifractor porci]MST82167.1 ABC-F family ATP-binding cassette domain-containing protein [Bilifractor porci]